MFQSGDTIPVEAIPESLRNRVGPDAPARLKGLIAKAALPMPPEDLGVALAILARDTDPGVQEDAVASLKELPNPVVQGIVSSSLPGEVLDVYAHAFAEEFDLLQRMIANQSVFDTTVAHIARYERGRILDVVASNQVRLVRAPAIIESMIANPSSPTPILARVIETALRNGVDTSEIVGFRPLAQAFFAELDTANQAEPEEDESTVDGEPIEDDFDMQIFDAGLFEGVGIDDDELEALLTGNTDGLVDEEGNKKPMWKAIEDMSVPQKVRLAMLGDKAARKLLIRDPKKTVAQAVLTSPRLTYKEIGLYASDKSLDGEIISRIARERKWTKHYSVLLSLVQNPKTPTAKTLTFLKSLRRRDLQNLSRARDVPGPVRRSAKNMINMRGSR